MQYQFIWYLCFIIIFASVTVQCLQVNVVSRNEKLSVFINKTDYADNNYFSIYINGSGCFQSDNFQINLASIALYTNISIGSGCSKLVLNNNAITADGVTFSFIAYFPALSQFTLYILGNRPTTVQQIFSSPGMSSEVTNFKILVNSKLPFLYPYWSPPSRPNGLIVRYLVWMSSIDDTCVVWLTTACSDCGSINVDYTLPTHITSSCVNITSNDTFSQSVKDIYVEITSPIINPHIMFSMRVAPINVYGLGSENLIRNASRQKEAEPVTNLFTNTSFPTRTVKANWDRSKATMGQVLQYLVWVSYPNNTCMMWSIMDCSDCTTTFIGSNMDNGIRNYCMNISSNIKFLTNTSSLSMPLSSTLFGLYTTYTINVVPINGWGWGKSVEGQFEFKSPDFGDESAMVAVMSKSNVASTSSQIYITLPYSYVTDNQGKVVNFSLAIVAAKNGVINKAPSDSEKTYSDCDKGTKCPYYIVLPFPARSSRRKRDTAGNSSSNWANVDFIIGDGSGCGSCNGPLNPSTDYRIGFRACSDAGCNTITITKSTGINAVAIIISVTLIGVIAILVILLVVFLRRRDSNQSKSVPYFVTVTLSPRVTHFDEYYKVITKNQCEEANRQFAELDDLRKQFEKSGKLAFVEGNDKKNRFRNIRPYQYNAIRLTGTDNYINASKICTTHCNIDSKEPCNCPSYYIAAQSPIGEDMEDLTSTTGEFWRMLVENDVRIIINLTNSPGDDPDRCAQYWPENVFERETYYSGDHVINVTLQQLTRNKTYDERVLDIIMEGKMLTMTQFHYTGWKGQDSVVVSDFLEFYNRFDEIRQPKDIVAIHCSNGVGRTGVWILLNMELVRINSDCSNVEIYNTLLNLRQGRCCMVNTKKQYVLVHEIIMEYLKGKDKLWHQDNSIINTNVYSNESFD